MKIEFSSGSFFARHDVNQLSVLNLMLRRVRRMSLVVAYCNVRFNSVDVIFFAAII